MQPITENTHFYGDNLEILREYISTESADLIYLDPPFNSNRNYNVLFRNESGKESEAQITAFEDTWHWGRTPNRAGAPFHQTVCEPRYAVRVVSDSMADDPGLRSAARAKEGSGSGYK